MKKNNKKTVTLKKVGISATLLVLILVVSISLSTSGYKSSSKTIQTTVQPYSPLSVTTTFKTITETSIAQEAVLQGIYNIISIAQNYYNIGEYMLAVDSFKKAQFAIKDSKLSAARINELINGFVANYNKAKDIVDTAKMHFGNAMMLEYKKNFDEAKKELQAALIIYPKYKDASDSLVTFKTLIDPQIKISAESALVMSCKDGKILLQKNASELMYPASTTKMLTAILAIENISDFTRVVEITENESGYYGSSFGLKTGDKITLLDLLKALLIDSNNGAAIAIADYLAGNINNFADMMNEKAQKLGAVTARFENPNGLDNLNNYNIATAIDLALIAKYCMQNDMFKEIVNTQKDTATINGTKRTIWNTNHLLSLNYVKGIKTGYTKKAGQCLVIYSEKYNLPLITVLLNCDSNSDRSKDAKNLIELASKNYRNDSSAGTGQKSDNNMYMF